MSSSALVIVPDRSVRSLLSLLLKDAGAQVDCLLDPLAGPDRCRAKRYDLLVLAGFPGQMALADLARHCHAASPAPALLLAQPEELGSLAELPHPERCQILSPPWNPVRLQPCLPQWSEESGATEAPAETVDAPPGPVPPGPTVGAPALANTAESPDRAAPVTSARELEEQARARYQPVFLAGQSPALRRLLDDLWANRHATEPLLLEGEPGSEFEPALWELLHMAGDFHSYPTVLGPSDFFSENVQSLFAMDRLGEGLPGLYLVKSVDILANLRAGELSEFLSARRHGTVPARPVRLVFAAEIRPGPPDSGTERARQLLQPHLQATITLPPLRDRREDLPLLVRQLFLQTIRSQPHLRPRAWEASAIELLQTSTWPGNLDQLLQVIRQATARSRSLVVRAHELEPLLPARA